MPFFQDERGRGRSSPPVLPEFTFPSSSLRANIRSKASEESLRTELCEGPLLESLSGRGSPGDEAALSSRDTITQGVSNRTELIQRLKYGENPTWVPNRSLESFLLEYETTPFPIRPSADNTLLPSLRPAAEIQEPSHLFKANTDHTQAGLTLERPRSALHRGDFTEERLQNHQSGIVGTTDSTQPYSPQPSTLWLATSPPRDFSPFLNDPRFSSTRGPLGGLEVRSSAPSLSSSLSSSFVFKAPTSPLVQSESNDDLELSPGTHLNVEASFPRNTRRHTFQNSHSFNLNQSINRAFTFERQLPSLRRDNTYPYQAHQPRRSITSNIGISNPGSSPQSPAFLRSRRPSFASDFSPLNHASMVGSYEESIINGRMSTAPSLPLEFVAQIGVLGLGKCKPSLQCPPHVSLSFPAVFYSYKTTSYGRPGRAEDGPSPYVGAVDLENDLPNLDDEDELRRTRRSAKARRHDDEDIEMFDAPEKAPLFGQEIGRAARQKKRSSSPIRKAPPGGSYRIPEKGRLQIIIKNPNKTAVKVFLVPYDLEGMEPGTKTFIRQRILSGPITESPANSPAKRLSRDSLQCRETLRYLVHLNICCTSRGRFYLYKKIRLVFANRVLDNEERLHNIIQMPEPKFSVYKAGRDVIVGYGHGSATGTSLTAEKQFRRRSSGFPLSNSHRVFDTIDGVSQSLQSNPMHTSGYPHDNTLSTTPVDPIPFGLYRQISRSGSESQIFSLTSSKDSRPTTSQDSGMSASWNSNSTGISGYDKLSKGDVGYGGNAFSALQNGQQTISEGLIAQTFKGMGEGKAAMKLFTDGI